KGAQTVILVGDPTKAETIVQRVKFPPHFKVPPHTHPYSEVVTVLSGTYWNAMGDDMEKGATQGTLRLDLIGGSTRAGNRPVQRVQKRQVRLLWCPTVLTGSIGIRPRRA